MAFVGIQRAFDRVQAILAKGPYHLMQLGRWYAAVAAQRMFDAWSSSAIGEAAFLSQLTLPRVQGAVRSGDLVAAKKAMVQHFRNRAQPRFFFEPARAQTVAADIDTLDRARCIAEADEIRHGVFRFRGESPVTFEDAVDWFHCPQGNADWTWELNRHSYFVTLGRAYAYTGDEAYVRTFRAVLLDWLARNPVGVDQRNWASTLEVAYRINVWLWAYHHFLTSPTFDDETLFRCLHGLWIHARYLAANLEYHVPNNHLLLESKALAMYGLIFPEFRQARVWLDHGLSILWQQVRQQVSSDGVHAEQATLYHQVIASELLEILVLLENNAVAVPPDILEAFTRMVEFEHAITKPDGRIPLIGDSALGDSYLRFSMTGGAVFLDRADLASAPIDEAVLWLIGPERAARLNAQTVYPSRLTSRAFPAGGYFVMRHGESREAAYLIFDCGPLGYRAAPGHGHADALSFELYAGGRTLIVDPGVYSYHLGSDWRTYFRSTAAHNTITVDGLDQSRLLGAWHVIRPARATLHAWITTPRFDFVDGSHDGYTRLRQPLVHRRQIFFAKPEYWIVLDLLDGQGRHEFDLYFHLGPDAQVALDPDSGTARVRHAEGAHLLICPVPDADTHAEVISGSLHPIQGWVSCYSGEKTPAPTLRLTKIASAPTTFKTVLYPYSQTDQAHVRVAPLAIVEAAGRVLDERAVTGLRIEIGPWVDYFVADHRERPGRKIFGEYITDGRLVYLREHSTGGMPVRAIVHGGSELRRGKVRLATDTDQPVTVEPVLI